MTRLKTPGRNAGTGNDLGNRPRASGSELRRLEHHGIAEGERGRDLPRGNRDGEVPGSDDPDDADGLAGDLDGDSRTDRRRQLAADPQRFPGEELEDVPRAGHFADSLLQRFSLFSREEPADLFAAGEDLRPHAIERVRPELDVAPGPFGERRAGGGDGVSRDGLVGVSVLAHGLVEVGGIEIRLIAGALHPGAADRTDRAGSWERNITQPMLFSNFLLEFADANPRWPSPVRSFCLLLETRRGRDIPALAGFDAVVAKGVADWEVPALAVAVVKDGELVFAKGYGVLELGKAGVERMRTPSSPSARRRRR